MAHNNRVIVPGLPHYVTQHGYREEYSVFREATDYRVFLNLLEESCGLYEVALWGYALLPGSYALVVVPDQIDSLDAAMRRLDTEYSRYHQLRHMVRGQILDTSYCPMAMCWSQVWDALVLAERQPVREESVSVAWAHTWSSAAARLGRAPRPGWLRWAEWERNWSSSQWMKRLQHFENEAQFCQELNDAYGSGGTLGLMVSLVDEPRLRIGPKQAITVGRKGLKAVVAS